MDIPLRKATACPAAALTPNNFNSFCIFLIHLGHGLLVSLPRCNNKSTRQSLRNPRLCPNPCWRSYFLSLSCIESLWTPGCMKYMNCLWHVLRSFLAYYSLDSQVTWQLMTTGNILDSDIMYLYQLPQSKNVEMRGTHISDSENH